MSIRPMRMDKLQTRRLFLSSCLKHPKQCLVFVSSEILLVYVVRSTGWRTCAWFLPVSPGSWTTSLTCACPITPPSPSPRSSSVNSCWTPTTQTSSSRPSQSELALLHWDFAKTAAINSLQAVAILCSLSRDVMLRMSNVEFSII